MEKREQITLKLPPRLLGRLEAVREHMAAKPTMTACIEVALERWVDEQEHALKIKPKK